MTAPYNLSDSTLEIADRFLEILTAQKVALGIQDVWFGDQLMIPRTPALCVEPGVERRSLNGVPDMTQMLIDTTIFLYHSVVGSEQQQARRNCIQFAKDVQHYLHVNHTRLYNAAATQQLTIHGWCTDFDPQYRYRQGTLHNAVQMTWTSLTKVSLQRVF
jgi:hypothetical protein